MRIIEFERFDKVDLEHELYSCDKCRFCAICPFYVEELWEGLTPRGKIYYTKKLLEGTIKEIHPKYVESVFKCTLCGHCSQVCCENIDLVQLQRGMRAEIGRRGLWPQSIKTLKTRLERDKNIYNLSNTERDNWSWNVEDRVRSKINSKADVAYFIGCVSSFSARLSGIPVSMIKIFEAANVEYTLLGQDEWCCGLPHLLTVLNPRRDPLTNELVNHNIERLRSLGVRTLVTGCAGCYRAFKKEYPDVNKDILEFEVLHSSEFIERLMNRGKLNLTRKIDKNVTYHDPCELGRHCDVFDPPRHVLENIPGLKLSDFEKSRADCRCCGGGGLTNLVYPNLAVNIGGYKLDEALEVGANVISSCCPSCKMTISNAILKKKSQIQCIDLIELVASAI